MNKNMRKMYTEEQIVNLIKKNSKCLISGIVIDDENVLHTIIPSMVNDENIVNVNFLDLTNETATTRAIDFENQTISNLHIDSAEIHLQNIITGEIVKTLSI